MQVKKMLRPMKRPVKGFSQGGPKMFTTQASNAFFDGAQMTPAYLTSHDQPMSSENAKVSAFNLGKADVDGNAWVEEVMVTGARATENYISFDNMDPNKVLREDYVDYIALKCTK
nr:hypothetical protein [Tanacetum cinerariifolium]